MLFEEEKMVVAQNCPGYRVRTPQFELKLGGVSESCNNCANYVRGRCQKDLYDTIQSQISRN